MASRTSIRISAVAATACFSVFGYHFYEKRHNAFFNSRGVTCVFNQATCKEDSQNAPDKLTLEQVLVVFRHGARTPMSPNRHVPAEVWDAEILMKDIKEKHIKYNLVTADGNDASGSSMEHYFPRKILKGGCTGGSLTNVGQMQLYHFGQELRNEYIVKKGFMGKDYEKESLYVRTTNIERTIKSAVCLLSGLYSPENVSEPLSIITGPLEQESMYPNYYNCKKLSHWVRRAFGTADALPSLQKLSLEVVSIASLEDCSTPIEIVLVRDEVAARVAHNIPVPQILLDKYDILEKAAVLVQSGVVYGENDTSILRLSIGHFVEELCQKMEALMAGKTSHKLCLFSSHDTSLMSLLMSLGVFDGHWPNFASDIRLELFRDQDHSWYVRVRYNGKALTLPGCSSSYCSWERFQKLVAPVRVKNWDEECENKKEKET